MKGTIDYQTFETASNTGCTKNDEHSEVQINNDNNMDEPKLTWFICNASLIASLGGILFGYDMGVVSSALPQVSVAFDLSETQQECVVSFLYLGACLGAIGGGYICDLCGRRMSILGTDVIFIVGSYVLYASNSIHVLLFGRFVIGFAVSLSACADVAYLTEIAPKYWRGSIVSCNEASISLGFLVAYTSGYALHRLDPDNGWRVMFGLSCIIAILQLIGMVRMPESPIWLSLNNKHEEAKLALMQIHEFTSIDQVETYYNTIFQQILQSEAIEFDDDNNIMDDNKDISSSWLSNIKNKSKEVRKEMQQYYKEIIIALFLCTIQQWCGHTNVLNFAPEIFAQAGLGNKSSLASTILLGTVKFLTTTFVIWKIESIGRRTLLLFGMSCISLSLLLMIIGFYNEDNVNEQFAVSGAVGMALGYASSFAPLTWLLTSEMFPSQIRGRALGMSTFITYLNASLVSYTFFTVQNFFGSYYIPFIIYLIITLISIIFAILAIPDTRCKSTSEIHRELKSMWFWKKISELRFRQESISTSIPQVDLKASLV